MLAIELSTSSDWAREMRGTASIARAVTPCPDSFSTRSGFSAGEIRLISVWPSCSRAISSSVGALIFRMTSASHTSEPTTSAPAAANAASS